ncbi:MAG: GFA family protein [Pseudomonadota bacterium]
MSHRGACQCGQLTITADADPEIVLVCTCVQCQRRSGSAFTHAAFFLRDRVTVTGRARTWIRPAPGGRTLTNHFCPDCGTTLFWAPEIRPDYYGVAAGCLETRIADPSMLIWASEKPDWLAFPAGWAQHAGSPQRR